MRQMKLFYTCHNCEHEFEVSVSPVIPANTYGPPELCHPAEGGEIDPSQCPKCEAAVTEETIRDSVQDAQEAAEERWADDRREDR